MKKIVYAFLILLMIFSVKPVASFAGPHGIIENPAIVVSKADITVDGNIDEAEGYSEPAKMNYDTCGFFWAHNPLSTNADVYYAYDEEGVYIAADIFDGLEAIDERTGDDLTGLNSFVYSTGFDNIDVSERYPYGYGWNGDVFGVMFDPLGALMAEGFTGSTDLSANYLVGLFEGDEAKVFKLNTSEPGDVTDKVEAAGHKTETGWCFELKISWDDIIADTEEASLGFVNITKEDILTRNSLIKTSVLYQDRFYDMESLSVETWGRYITAAETLPDGTPGHMGNGENIGSYGISLYLDICSSNGHSFTDYKYDGNATCSKDGTKTAYCDNGCGTKDTVTATGTSTGKHNYKESVLTEATCENEGIMLYLCECGNNYTKSIPKAHKEKWMVVVEPTTTEEGKEIKYCTVCTVVLETKTLPKKNSTVFVDVSASAWYSEGVSYCSGKGYITGIGNNKFNPEGKLSREQFVVILARVAGADLTKYTKTEFNDVEVNSWYGPSVIWSNESGYVNGTGNGRFGVGMNIDRESLATLFYRYAQKQGIDVDKRADLSGYSDYYLISSWSKEACSWAVNVGILGSTDINLLTLSPKMTVTRAQAAKIFMSYDNIK